MIGAAIGAMAAMAAANAEYYKAEKKRWDSLTKEQQEHELHIREVQALERLARARENPPEIHVSLF